MKMAGRGTASRKNELAKWSKLLLIRIDLLFQTRGPVGRDLGDVSLSFGAPGRSEHRAQGKELTLNLGDQLLEGRVQPRASCDPQGRGRLTNFAICLYPVVILGDPSAAE